mmetsp:Transcript_10669/g.25682  ORF Transcript_10669/g.25682 Transcript_10669/m.25682 type:complete len:402 (+) Transcript_10669:100-1305(+)
MASPKIKKEKGSLQQKKYTAGTMLAVDLYANGNFFEARLKNYRSDKRHKDANWAYMEYLDDKETKGWIDLNVIQVVELVEENILSIDDENLTEDEKGFLGRRLTVAWVDDAKYSGTITKTMRDKKTFVYISYDNGDKCWYNLEPECEQEPQVAEANQVAANKRSGRKTKPSTKIKKEAMNAQEESSTGKKSIIDADFKKHDSARKQLEKKYPVGSTIAVDVYHDEHYHEAILKKYLMSANKRQMAKGEQWVYIQFLDKAKTKQWIDLSCIKVIKMTPEKTIRLDKITEDDEKGFLGKWLVVQWSDGNKYRGLATRSSKDNKYFVFLEYDDGDECWCDLQRETEWSIDGEDSFKIDEDEDNSSSSESEVGKTRAQPKRKGNTEASGQSNKKLKPLEDTDEED